MPTAVTHCAMGHACVETRTENMDQANCEALYLWDSSHYLQQPHQQHRQGMEACA